MVGMTRVQADFAVSDDFRRLVAAAASRSGLRDAVPGLVLCNADDPSAQRSLELGFYERDEIPSADPIFMVRVDEALEFLVIQADVVELLRGRSVGLSGGRLVVSAKTPHS
jgi:hypothetical protein